MNRHIFCASLLCAMMLVNLGNKGFGADTSSTEQAGVKSPEVGIKPIAPDEYKPVVGKYGGRIVMDSLGEPKSFNPVTAGETSTTEFTGRMFQGLVDGDPFTAAARPLLATQWEVADDGLTWTFHLRKDVVFNDGTPFTAQDVVFTWNDLIYDNTRPAGTDPRWPSSARDSATFDGKQIKFEAIDDYTVKVTTPVKIAILDQMVGEGILSKKKYEPLVKDGSFGGAMSTDSKAEDLVGTGPFILGEYKRGEHVILKRNSHFWKKDSSGQSLPYLDEEVFQVVHDMNTMLINFEQGVTDYYGVPSGKEVARLKPKQADGNFALYQFGPDDGDLFLTFNQNLDAAKAGAIPDYKVAWFRDTRFRQAISFAIDRGAQVRNIRRNLGYPEGAPMTLAAGQFRQEGFPAPAYDPDKAKALLADMGFKPGADGILVDPAGHQLSFTINTNSGNEMRQQTVDFIRKDLEKIGVKVNSLFLEFNLLVDKLDSSHDWECIVMGLTGGREPHFGANVWQSFGRTHMWWPDQKTPSTDWEKKIDDIFVAGIQELDPVKRKAIYRQWVQIAYDQQPFIYLTVSEDVAAMRQRFGNVFPTPVGHLLHNEEEFFVK